MFTKLDTEVIALLCCPLCKGDLSHEADIFSCDNCSTPYERKEFSTGEHNESIPDFRLHYPNFCIPPVMRRWAELQEHYEHTQERYVGKDKHAQYVDEIDSVKEIYTDEFQISGSVLDVGGHVGKLRHFLPEKNGVYVSVDPFWNSFQDIEKQPDLLEVYPSISEPCNFMATQAEYLPFRAKSFDWVHMRSVIDHFADPYLAFKEAYRVLRPGGQLLIGLAIVEKMTAEHNRKKRNILSKCVKKLKKGKQYSFKNDSRVYGGPDDDHMYRLTHNDLLELLKRTGFEIGKEHWQKEPFSYCLYVSGLKK